jgi:hypothetical protein
MRGIVTPAVEAGNPRTSGRRDRRRCRQDVSGQRPHWPRGVWAARRASRGTAPWRHRGALRGDDDRAARLLGAAAEHRYGQPKDPVDATFFEPARTRRGADEWDAAAREGSALSFEDAIAYALQEPPA